MLGIYTILPSKFNPKPLKKLVLCRAGKTLDSSGSGVFRKNRVRLVWVESGNANKNYIKSHNGDIYNCR